MSRGYFRRCFISASFGTDTSALREALEQREIHWQDQTSMEAGSRWLDVIESGVSRSDFVIAVLGEGYLDNILFELGIAYAKRKPILAFLSSGRELPSDISSLTYVRADPTNREAIELALDSFLEHARPRPPLKRYKSTSSSKSTTRGLLTRLSPLVRHNDAEDRTAALLQQAGFIVSAPTQQRIHGADFAVWMDDLEDALGSPILVEVKAGNLSSQRLRESASRLRKHVANTHGRGALLIYWDQADREFPTQSLEWPLVIQMSGRSLTQHVAETRLVQELLRLRNMAVHGRV